VPGSEASAGAQVRTVVLDVRETDRQGLQVATVVLGDFEWDDRKAATNLRNHRVSFEEAITALADPAAVTAPDLYDPDRSITIGASTLLRVLFVVGSAEEEI